VNFKFFLFIIDSLAGQFYGGLSRGDAQTILLHTELRITHLDANLVLQLLQPELGLPIFKFRPHLRGLTGAIPEGDAETQLDSFVRQTGIHQLIQRRAERNGRLLRGRCFETTQLRVRKAYGSGIGSTPEACASVKGRQIQRRQ